MIFIDASKSSRMSPRWWWHGQSATVQ